MNIGTIDCTRKNINDLCKEYKANGFPTLKYFPTNSPRMYKYDGEKTIDDLKAFVHNEMWKNLPGEPLPGSKVTR